MGSNGMLTKLKITAFSDPEQGAKVGEFEAFYNPTSFTALFSVKYADINKGTTNSKHEMRYAGYDQATFTIEFMLDGTGASSSTGSNSGEKLDVDKKIADFNKYVYGYQGDTHRPTYLLLEWGEAIKAQKVVLTTVTITRDLFSPDGKTLRAKLNCTFKEYSYVQLIEAEMEKKSPDMTHMRVVKQGDRLPLMCEGIYGDDRLYLQVARYNGLSDYRKLTPGQKLYFPPLQTASK